MTLPATGPLSMSQVSTEIGRASNAATSLNDSPVRSLAGVASGAIGFSNLRGKGTMSVVGNGDSRSYSSAGGNGNADSFPTVTITGGAAPFTYVWSFTSNPNAATLVGSTLAAPTVRKAFTSGTTGGYTATLQCVVTDSASNTQTATGISAHADWAP